MDKKSIYGLQRKQLCRILSMGSEALGSALDDRIVAKILQDRLKGSFVEDSSLPNNKSLIHMLLDPESDTIVLQSIIDYAKILSKSVDSEAELVVIFTIYYAVAATLLVNHARKIDDYSYESLSNSFAELLEKKWIPTELKQLLYDAQKICHEKER